MPNVCFRPKLENPLSVNHCCMHCGWLACRLPVLLFTQSSYQFTRGDEEGEDFSQENEGELLLEDGGKRSEMAETEPAGKDEKEPLDRRRTLFKATTCVHLNNSSSRTSV